MGNMTLSSCRCLCLYIPVPTFHWGDASSAYSRSGVCQIPWLVLVTIPLFQIP